MKYRPNRTNSNPQSVKKALASVVTAATSQKMAKPPPYEAERHKKEVGRRQHDVRISTTDPDQLLPRMQVASEGLVGIRTRRRVQ